MTRPEDRRLRVLVTNDDGVTSPGLHALASELAGRGHDVVVVAPSTDHSGYGAALGPLHVTGTIDFERVVMPDVDRVSVVAVHGPPALCVLAACLTGFGPPPDVVVSGINAGANTGRAVLHSGTVGAALTANGFGIPAIAVSQAAGDSGDWTTAAIVAADLATWIVACGDVFTMNVNVPDGAVTGGATHVAMLDPGGQVQTTVVESAEGVLQLQFTPDGAPTPGTDTAIVASGCIAITPLSSVQAREIVIDDVLPRIADALRGRSDQQVA